MDFLKWLDENLEEDNLCDPPMEPQVAVKILKDYLLGEDWYSVMPQSTEQINTEIVFCILDKYSKRFRKEIKEERKRIKHERT